MIVPANPNRLALRFGFVLFMHVACQSPLTRPNSRIHRRLQAPGAGGETENVTSLVKTRAEFVVFRHMFNRCPAPTA